MNISIIILNVEPMDFLNIFLTLGGIAAAYFLAEHVYSKEKTDRKIEDLSIQYSENELLIQNLQSIIEPIKKQEEALKKYNSDTDFKLDFYPEIQVDFLQFINIRAIYKKHGIHNPTKILTINSLMTNLFTIVDFRESLRSEVTNYIKKYNYHEEKFYTYRQLLYNKYYELCNLRAVEILNEKGIKSWKFDEEDSFMNDYTTLLYKTFADPEIINDGKIVSRKKLNERFILPLVKLSHYFIPEDINAIEINELANEVNSAFLNMDTIDKKHSNAINGHITSLETVRLKILEFLNLPA